jgi:hypothetical protein
MKTKEISICSFFQTEVTPGPPSPCRRGRPPCSPTCSGCRQICRFLCGSKCYQGSPQTWAHLSPTTGYPQRHQVGTTSGQTRWGQSGDPDDRKGCQERGEMGWCYLRQGGGNRRAKVPPGFDPDSRGGETAMGSDRYGVRSSAGRLFRGRRTRRMDILQPAPGAARMRHLLRAPTCPCWQRACGCSTEWW